MNAPSHTHPPSPSPLLPKFSGWVRPCPLRGPAYPGSGLPAGEGHHAHILPRPHFHLSALGPEGCEQQQSSLQGLMNVCCMGQKPQQGALEIITLAGGLEG